MDVKNVLVVGMARSGIAAAKFLRELNPDMNIRLCDQRRREDFAEGSFSSLEEDAFEWRLGETPEDALDGIDMVVLSPGVPIDHPLVSKARAMGIEVIGEVELASRVAKARLVAITGTNGKTTTTSLAGELFLNAGITTHVVGNIGHPITAVAHKARYDDVIICEVSSFQLETISTFHPNIAAILNITEDHMDRHHTMDAYISLKARVFENQGADDYLVLNYGDMQTRQLAPLTRARVLWFSRVEELENGAFVDGDMIAYACGGVVKRICPVAEIGVPGAHNLENALAAVCIGIAAEIPLPVIRHTLRTFKGVPHRIEYVREIDGVNFINDSKGTNCDSTIKAIETMDRPTVLIMGGYNKHVDLNPVCEKLVGSRIEHVVLIGETAQLLEESLGTAGFLSFEHAGEDFGLAVELARRKAENGWNVLLSPACASFDMFEDFERRGDAFKRIVNQMEPLFT